MSHPENCLLYGGPAPIKPVNSPLYVVTCISNPVRYRTRYDLYRKFEKYVADSGAVLYTIEANLREREYEITEVGNQHHIQVNTRSELWHKENLINLAIQRLPSDWKYVAWIDADIIFTRPDWVYETIHQLQHYHVVQMFSQATDLGPDYRSMGLRDGVIYGWRNNDCGPLKRRYGGNNHPGYAWAARRSAIDMLGGLIDWGVIGSADWHMACALVGQIEKSMYPALYDSCPNYVKWCHDWAERARKHINLNVGYVDGLVLHYWHGKKSSRKYHERWQVITDNGFDPAIDLRRDWQGMWQLTDENAKLRDALRGYFRARNEDGIDI